MSEQPYLVTEIDKCFDESLVKKAFNMLREQSKFELIIISKNGNLVELTENNSATIPLNLVKTIDNGVQQRTVQHNLVSHSIANVKVLEKIIDEFKIAAIINHCYGDVVKQTKYSTTYNVKTMSLTVLGTELANFLNISKLIQPKNKNDYMEQLFAIVFGAKETNKDIEKFNNKADKHNEYVLNKLQEIITSITRELDSLYEKEILQKNLKINDELNGADFYCVSSGNEFVDEDTCRWQNE